jgi:predicted transcriptional regulator
MFDLAEASSTGCRFRLMEVLLRRLLKKMRKLLSVIEHRNPSQLCPTCDRDPQSVGVVCLIDKGAVEFQRIF